MEHDSKPSLGSAESIPQLFGWMNSSMLLRCDSEIINVTHDKNILFHVRTCVKNFSFIVWDYKGSARVIPLAVIQNTLDLYDDYYPSEGYDPDQRVKRAIPTNIGYVHYDQTIEPSPTTTWPENFLPPHRIEPNLLKPKIDD